MKTRGDPSLQICFVTASTSVVFMQETKITEDLDEHVDDYRFINLGGDAHHGLGFLIHCKLQNLCV